MDKVNDLADVVRSREEEIKKLKLQLAKKEIMDKQVGINSKLPT